MDVAKVLCVCLLQVNDLSLDIITLL